MTKVPAPTRSGDLRHVTRGLRIEQGPTKTARPDSSQTSRSKPALRVAPVHRGVRGHPIRARQLGEPAGGRRIRGVLHTPSNDSAPRRYRADIGSSHRLSTYGTPARAPRTEVTVQPEIGLQEPNPPEREAAPSCPIQLGAASLVGRDQRDEGSDCATGAGVGQPDPASSANTSKPTAVSGDTNVSVGDATSLGRRRCSRHRADRRLYQGQTYVTQYRCAHLSGEPVL